MAEVLYSPECDSARLSAYRDNMLDAAHRRLVELHLEACPACRQEAYHDEQLSAGLRHLAGDSYSHPLPSAFTRSAAVRPALSPPRRATRPLLGASLLAALTFAVLLQRVPSHPITPFEAYPVTGASDVSVNTAIIITFQQPVNQAQVRSTLQFQPQVSFDLTWESAQRAELIPMVPLAPATTYTLRAAVPPEPEATLPSPTMPPFAAPARATAPQTITVFQTASRSVTEGAPLALVPRADLFTRGQPASISHSVLAVPATPSPVGLPSASRPTGSTTVPNQAADAPALGPAAPFPRPEISVASTSSGQGGGAGEPTTLAAAALAKNLEQPALLPPCAPANVFTPVYTSRGDIRAALGCVLGTTRSTTLVSQDFQRGELLATLPDGVLYELTTEGIWRAYTLGDAVTASPALAIGPNIGPVFQRYWQTHPVLNNSLGQPVAPETHGQGVLQPFAHGFMLATDAWTYIADDAGQWQRLVSLLPTSDSGRPDGGAITGGVASFPSLRPASTRGITVSTARDTLRSRGER